MSVHEAGVVVAEHRAAHPCRDTCNNVGDASGSEKGSIARESSLCLEEIELNMRLPDDTISDSARCFFYVFPEIYCIQERDGEESLTACVAATQTVCFVFMRGLNELFFHEMEK
jgi:hypothetical protein